MYKGEKSKGLDFYKLLTQSEKFTSELGKVTLASGKLETELILYLTRKQIVGNYRKATLGKLLKIANRNNLFCENEKNCFNMILEQRNYITHNLHALFADLIDETILEKDNLLDSDVHLYIDRTWQMTENINGLADIVKNK